MNFKNIFYFENINSIGGVETFFYYLAKKYNKYDIAIVYKFANARQLNRLQKYVKCIQDNQSIKYECENVFFNYSTHIINRVKANKYYQIIHADYKKQKITPIINPKITNYIGVSEEVCKSFKDLTGIECELCYNPLFVDEPKKVLRLISASRLTKEKGKERIERLSKILDKKSVNYLWTIFTDDKNAIDNPNIIYVKPKLNIIDYINDSDFLVQLSSSEAYCYAVVESLMVKTPVIVTNLDVYNEIGLDDSNSIKLDLDFDDIDLDKLNKKYNFIYNPKEDIYSKFLDKTKSKYKEVGDMQYKVRALSTYKELGVTDNQLGCIPEEGTEFDVTKERLDLLLGNNGYKKKFVELVPEDKKLPTKGKKAIKK